jgi:hypothetical protein
LLALAWLVALPIQTMVTFIHRISMRMVAMTTMAIIMATMMAIMEITDNTNITARRPA